MVYVFLYLLAIVLANLSVAAFGPAVSVLNAFLFIGFDLIARDRLHDHWRNNRLWPKMFLLVATGSLLSFALNTGAANIAMASFVAFGAAGVADAVAYHALRDRPVMQRMNGSNLVAAGVDSVIFPAMAFGFPLLAPIMIGQYVAKIAGGFVWSAMVVGLDRRVAQHRA